MAVATIDNSQGAIMRSNYTTPTSWDYAHDLTSANNVDTTNNSGTGLTVGVGFSGYGGGTYYIYRTYLDFDLSSIPAGSTINSATLKLYGASISSPHFSIAVYESDFIVLKGTFTDGSTLAADMYDQFEGFQAGWDGTDAGIIEYSGEEHSSWSTSGYNETTLNATCRSDIASRAGGSTRLAMVIMNHDHDYHDNTDGENGNPVNGTYDYFKVNFNMQPDASNPPQLVVDYDEAVFLAETNTKLKTTSANLNIKSAKLTIK